MREDAKVIWLVVFTSSVILATAEKFNSSSSVNQTTTTFLDHKDADNNATRTSTSERRRGRQLQIDRIELPFSGTEVKRHLVKIPPNVSRVKVIGSTPVARPRKLLHRRVNNQIPYYSSEGQTNRKYPQEPDEYDRMDFESVASNDLRRNFRKVRGPEPVYDEFYDENTNLGLSHYVTNEEPVKYKKFRLVKRPMKAKRKIPKEGLDHGGERFVQSEDKEYAIVKNRYRAPERDESGYYDYESVEPLRYIKQFPSGLYGLKTKYTQDVGKQSEKPLYGKYYETGNHLTIKRIPGKGKKTLLNQYTTHNPQVATNFGLSEFNNPNNYPLLPKAPYGESSAFGGTTADTLHNPLASASEHSTHSYPVLTPGIKVIQPPKFGEGDVGYSANPSRLSGSTPQQTPGPTGSQKATIRDILEQDCPGYEAVGFCESPPRYPMHQINLIVKKCASLMDAMSTPNLIRQDQQQEFSVHSERRSDVNVDNRTLSEDESDLEKHVISKRAAGDGVQACRSDMSVIEPGYAKEETTRRWFVIVQFPESIQQRITTDTCKNPGKPCAGLNEMKCIRAYASGSPQKSTKCVQKYAFHKLISWDPDAPDACPKMRTFKFPSACVCHVGVA